jgi:hypothetical protein
MIVIIMLEPLLTLDVPVEGVLPELVVALPQLEAIPTRHQDVLDEEDGVIVNIVLRLGE